jgi:hypothetical protein
LDCRTREVGHQGPAPLFIDGRIRSRSAVPGAGQLCPRSALRRDHPPPKPMTNVSIQTLCCRSGECPEARAITSSQHYSSRRRTEKGFYTFHSEYATRRTTLVPGLDLGGSLAPVLPLAVLARLPTPYPSTTVIYRLSS